MGEINKYTPFDKNKSSSRVISNLLWILNIVQFLGVLIIFFYQDMGWYMSPKDYNNVYRSCGILLLE